jgi:thiamine biosynthesis lipoprotein
MKKLLIASLFFCELAYSQVEPMIISGEAQGTTFEITYYDSLDRNFMSDILLLLSDFDHSVSTYQESSIISRINRNDKKVRVDDYFKTCFNKAKEIWKATDGAFDPTVYPLVNAWGWGPGKKKEITPQLIDSLLDFVGFEKIKLKKNHVVKSDPRVSLDFNAFAQGYSVDVVSTFLRNQGVRSFIVEIGGEVYAGDAPPGKDYWTVSIEQPLDNKMTKNPGMLDVKLVNRAVATSGNNRKFFVEDGVKYAHHLDPKTGYPAKNNLLAVSVFSPECISSDANATAILVMGYERCMEYLKLHPELQIVLVYSSGDGVVNTYVSPGLEKIFVE